MVIAVDYGQGERHPHALGGLCGCELDDSFLVGNRHALVHETVGKACVSRQHQRTAHDSAHLVQLLQTSRHVEREAHHVAGLPLTVQDAVGTCLHAVHRLSVHGHRRLSAPLGDAQGHVGLECLVGRQRQCDLARAGIVRLLLYREAALA